MSGLAVKTRAVEICQDKNLLSRYRATIYIGISVSQDSYT